MMFGMSGMIGGTADSWKPMCPELEWSRADRRMTYADDDVQIDIASVPRRVHEQPAKSSTGDTLVWLLGDVYGYRDDGEYVSCSEGTDRAALCASLYEEDGLEFVSRLNGEFVGVVFDRARGEISVFLDRLGTYTVFYSRPNEEFVFSTQIQALTAHHEIDDTFDHEFLFEYLTFRRVFGVHTPYEHVKKLPPASVTTVDLDTQTFDTDIYWTPTYRPIDKPIGYFVDRFKRTFTEVITDWVSLEKRYGLLLSGGSDSRLILAVMPAPVVAFHMADWNNREMRTARRVARAADAQFTVLHRTDEYYHALYELNAPLSNFDGYFFQGYTSPFADQIRNQVDICLSGLYADVLFKGYALPSKSVSLGRFGSISTPFPKHIDSIDSFIDHLIASGGNSLPEPPTYLDIDANMREILKRNITDTGESIDHHGVPYRSLDALRFSHSFYPLSNDTETIYTNSVRQIVPYRSPFLDNRLVDLHLRIPPGYRSRYNIINRVLSEIDSDLAEIPHGSTGIPLTYTAYLQYVGEHVLGLMDKYHPKFQPPKPYYSHSSWWNHGTFIREEDFLLDTLTRKEALLETLPFIDEHGAFATYTDHLDGADYTAELFTLVTLLGLPDLESYESPTARSPNRVIDHSSAEGS